MGLEKRLGINAEIKGRHKARYLGGWEQSGVDTSYLGQPPIFQRFTLLNDMGFNFIMEVR